MLKRKKRSEFTDENEISFDGKAFYGRNGGKYRFANSKIVGGREMNAVDDKSSCFILERHSSSLDMIKGRKYTFYPTFCN